MPSGGATVESIILKEGVAGSAGSGCRIATTILISSSQINSPINMAVGYGVPVPVLAATDSDGLMTNSATVVSGGALASSSSVPNSELTQDSPSPRPPTRRRGRTRYPRNTTGYVTRNYS